MKKAMACLSLLSFALIACGNRESEQVASAVPDRHAYESKQMLAASPNRVASHTLRPDLPTVKSYGQLKAELIRKYQHQVPHQWGERVTGVKTRLKTTDRVIALTFDACGGPHGSGYDAKLIQYLIQERIPATLFINSRWIEANPNRFKELAANPLFEIENHGFKHKPLSVNGKSAWGIKGTQNVGEVVDEVALNQKKLEQLTGRKPKFFRSGTAYYDEVAVRIAEELGVKVLNFDVLGDAGATFNREQVKQACLTAKPGSIIICHMNHPEKDTAEGIMLAVPELKRSGFKFVKAEAYPVE